MSPTSGKGFVGGLRRDQLPELGVGKIATVMGRYYAMDRDNRWERVQLAYDAMVYGEGDQNPVPGGRRGRAPMTAGVTDEFVEPVVCDSDGTVSDNDSVIFFNFRPDRAREITRSHRGPGLHRLSAGVLSPPTYVCNDGVRRLHAQRAGGLRPEWPVKQRAGRVPQLD